MGERCLLAAALLAILLAPTAGVAQPTRALAEDTEIRIDAEEISYDQRANTVVARRNVVIRRGDMELRADEVRLNRSTNEAAASGHVSITDPEGTVVADEIYFNLDDETGSLEAAEIQSNRYHYSLWGAHIEKGLGQSYRIENGRFTSCRCAEGEPSWSIGGKELRVALDGYGTLTGGTFDILGTPVLYIPRAVFPVQRDRQSGFLMPRFGASNRRGFQTVLPYYWAIDKSQDATVAVDVETSARLGLVNEYRYALSRDTHGILSGSYFNDSIGGEEPGNPPTNRWSVVGEHDQPFVGTSRAYADLFFVGDRLFLRDMNTYAFEHAHDVALRTLPFTQSRVGVLQLWDRVALRTEGVYSRDLTTSSGSQNLSATLQRVPQTDVWGQTLLGRHLLGDVRATAVGFQRSQTVDGVRVDVEPTLSVPLPLGQLAFGAVQVSARETAYHLVDREVTDGTGDSELPRNQSRELLQVGATVGTMFDRIYPFHWLGLEKLKHTLEPEIDYLYIPGVSQGDLPLWDGIDRVNQRSLVTYGMVSRFTGRFAPESEQDGAGGSPAPGASIRELGRLSLMQSYDITETVGAPGSSRANDHFSDFDFGGRVNPSRAFSLRFHTNYDAGHNAVTATKVGFFVEDPRELQVDRTAPHLGTRTSLGVSYRFQTQNNVQELQEVDSNAVLRLTRWAGFLYSNRYDVVADRFLDNFFGLRLSSTCDCWAVDLAFTDRTNPQEVEFRAQVTLVGLGSRKPQSRTAAVP